MMLKSAVITLFVFVPALSQNLVKPGQFGFRTPGSQSRLPPASAFAPAYAGSYANKLTEGPQKDSRTLPDHYHDARAIAPGLKKELAQQAIETAFAPRVPAYSETDTSGGATGFAPEYAPNYAPSFFGSATGSAIASAARPSTYSKPSSGEASGFAPSKPSSGGALPSSGGATGFAPEFAPLFAPGFFGSTKASVTGASAYQAASAPASAFAAPASASAFAAPAYNPQYSTPSGDGDSGFAPLFAPAYAPAFFGSSRTKDDSAPLLRSVLKSPAPAFSGASDPAPSFTSRIPQAVAGSSSGSSAGSGFAPLFGAAYAPSFGGRQMTNLDAAQTSWNVTGTIAVALMGLGISISGVILVTTRLSRSASTTQFKEPLV